MFFDDDYYCLTYEDVASPAFDRFAHFMRYGWREGRNPSRHFVTLYYRDKHLDGADINPLHHYATKGKALGLSTRPTSEDDYLFVQEKVSASFFPETDYRRRTGYSGDTALRDYLSGGWRHHSRPSYFFDGQEYLKTHRYVEALQVSPLYHFASQQRLMGKAPTIVPDVVLQPTEGTLIRSLDAPNYTMHAPNIKELDSIPASVRSVLQPSWDTREVPGRPVSIYQFRDVYLALEGLVFTEDGRPIDVTRTHHSDMEICEGMMMVAEARSKGSAVTIEKGVLAESRGASNYGHFILEMLPRAWLARSRLNLNWPAIIHAAGTQIQEVSRQALHCAGFLADEVLAVSRDAVFVRDLIFVDGLIGSPYISTIVLDCLDELTAQVSAAGARKVYVPRAPAFTRDFEDEPAAAAALADLGFERTPTFGMTFEAQVALFRGATEIVGVTGAALTNILFCRPGTRVVVFSPASAAELLFWLIAEKRGLIYEEVRCFEVGPQLGALPWDRLIRVTPDEVQRLIRG